MSSLNHRPVLIHYHIFKNAGMSLDRSLRRYFKTGWAEFELAPRTDSWVNTTAADIATFIEAHPQVRCVSSHTARWPTPAGPELSTTPVVFLRHPIDRAGSVYHYYRRVGNPDATSRSFAEYIDWLLGPRGNIVIRSFQTLFMSDDTAIRARADEEGGCTEVTENHVRQARQRVIDLPTVGVVEAFQTSVHILSTELAQDFPGLRIAVERENANTSRASSLSRRLDEIASALGSARTQRLEQANEADLDLHALATRKLEECARSLRARAPLQRVSQAIRVGSWRRLRSG